MNTVITSFHAFNIYFQTPPKAREVKFLYILFTCKNVDYQSAREFNILLFRGRRECLREGLKQVKKRYKFNSTQSEEFNGTNFFLQNLCENKVNKHKTSVIYVRYYNFRTRKKL